MTHIFPERESKLTRTKKGVICRDTGMCHYFRYIFGVSFWIVPGFLGIIFL